jgi:heme/copper-type cytochrome/quinol oxidase subunit 4
MSQLSSFDKFVRSIKIILFSGLIYALLFYGNDWLMHFLEVAPGVNWIYLPAGLRLFIVLIFGLPGAIGIAASSTLITYGRELGDDPLSIIGIGLISGFSPYIARQIVIRNLKINSDLSNLNIQIIVICVLIFAAMSAGLHQIWFALMHMPSASPINAIAMLIGDILGALLFISLIKFALDGYKRFSKKQSLL